MGVLAFGIIAVFISATVCAYDDGGYYTPKELPCQYRINITTTSYGQVTNEFIEANGNYTRIFKVNGNYPDFTYLFRPDIDSSGQWLAVHWYSYGGRVYCLCGEYGYDDVQAMINTNFPYLHASISYSATNKTTFHGEECTAYHTTEGVVFYANKQGYLIGQSNGYINVYYKLTFNASLSDFKLIEKDYPNCDCCKGIYSDPNGTDCVNPKPPTPSTSSTTPTPSTSSTTPTPSTSSTTPTPSTSSTTPTPPTPTPPTPTPPTPTPDGGSTDAANKLGLASIILAILIVCILF